LASEDDILLGLDGLHSFYTGYFEYFNTLNGHWQEVFNSRCMEFISEKTIIGAEGFKPNNKVKAIIAACAVQLTLGLDVWDLNYFESIIIHPSDFDDKASGLKYRGETNLAGFIRLSWKGFILGYKISDDNINLGLHEFTHALRLSPIKGSTQDYFVEHYFNKWQAAAIEAYYDIKNKRQTIFRKYGGVNMSEFTSVCIEHYFESPEEIKKQYPNLYYCTAILLNQQTQNNVTQIGIRVMLLNESNTLQKGFSDKIIKTAPLQSNSFVVAIIVSVPLIFTIYKTSFFSGGSIFLFLIVAAIYLRFDFKFTKMHFSKRGFILNKGFFIHRILRSSASVVG